MQKICSEELGTDARDMKNEQSVCCFKEQKKGSMQPGT